MDKNARDTHFQNFAKLLWDELVEANGYGYIDVNADDSPTDPTNYLRIISQRAYDLAVHVYSCSDWHINPPFDSLEEQVAKTPDMTTFPD